MKTSTAATTTTTPATTEVRADNFEALRKSGGIVLIDWWASWCGPCRMFAPIFEAAARQHPDITWGKVDTDKEQELAGEFAIRSIPTLMAFRDGILVFEQPGMLPAAALERLVAEIRKLDMVEVRAKVAAAQGERAAS